ncbi:MAG: hypothetical protein U0174_06380 [Polyangiaceae bacterium]
MRTSLLSLSFAFVPAVCLAVACGGTDVVIDDLDAGSTPPITTKDSGPKADGGITDPDSSTTKDSGSDASVGPLTIKTSKLVSGEFLIRGVTEDGYVAYLRFENNKTSAEVISQNGGTPIVLNDDLGDTEDIFVSGGAVGLWTNLDANDVGKFFVWTKANGLKDSTIKTAIGDFAASSDGSRVAYVKVNPTTEELMFSDTAFTIVPVQVQDDLGRGDNTTDCTPSYGFHKTFLVAATCKDGTTNATVRRVDSTGAKLTVTTGMAPEYSVNDNVDKVFTHTRNGAGRVYALSGGAFSQSVELQNAGVAQGFLAPDGTYVVFRTTPGVLRRGNATAPATNVDLSTTPVLTNLLDRSKDLKFVVTASKIDNGNPDIPRFDLLLQGTTTPAAPTVVVPTAISFPLGFTTDGSHYAYLTNVPAAGVFATMKLHPMTGGGQDVELGKDAFFFLPLGGKNFAYADTAREDANEDVIMDLKASAGVSTPQTIAKGVLAGIDSLGTKVFYVVPGDALYAADVQ